jgi:hypothetical protein
MCINLHRWIGSIHFSSTLNGSVEAEAVTSPDRPLAHRPSTTNNVVQLKLSAGRPEESSRDFGLLGIGTYVPTGILSHWVMFWGIHSMWKFRVQCPSTLCFLEVSATQPSVIESVQDCTTSREVLRWLALLYEPAERVTIDVKKQEIKRCRYSLYSWSCFLFY